MEKFNPDDKTHCAILLCYQHWLYLAEGAWTDEAAAEVAALLAQYPWLQQDAD